LIVSLKEQTESPASAGLRLCERNSGFGISAQSTSAPLNVLIRANALPLSITITVAAPSSVNETNISSANINGARLCAGNSLIRTRIRRSAGGRDVKKAQRAEFSHGGRK